MITAEIWITSAPWGAFSGFVHKIKFANLLKAKDEYARIVDLMERRSEKANDLPKIIQVVGDGSEMTLSLDEIRGIGLCDFALANGEETGVRDAYPNLFKT